MLLKGLCQGNVIIDFIQKLYAQLSRLLTSRYNIHIAKKQELRECLVNFMSCTHTYMFPQATYVLYNTPILCPKQLLHVTCITKAVERPPTLDTPCCLQWLHTVLPGERQRTLLEKCKRWVGWAVSGMA